MFRETATDPVCGMNVDKKNPPGGSVEYKGEKYFFCYPGCREKFESDPELYLKKSSA